MSKDFSYYTSDNHKIKITVYGDLTRTQPAVILAHGFKGFKDWGFFPVAAEIISDSGLTVVTFNFSHNGIGENTNEFTDFAKFAANTYSREVDEVIEISEILKNGFFDGFVPAGIALIGHSRGGAVSLLASASVNPFCIVTWAAISNFHRYSERQKDEWRTNGFIKTTNLRTGQDFEMNLSFLEDIEKNSAGKLNIKKAVQNLNIPYLIIHGEEDIPVKIAEAEKLYNWADKNRTQMQIIEKAGHTFNINHPFEKSNPAFEKLLELTIPFLKTHLKVK